MSGNPQKSPSFRLSRQGFQPLNNPNDNMGNSTDIPLQTVVSHTPSHTPTSKDESSEKSGIFHRGKRRVQKTDSKGNPYNPNPDTDDDDDKTALNRMGRIYMKILNFSIITRYMIYVAPLALILAIPIILAATKVIRKPIGGTDITGADPKLFFIWIEISKSVSCCRDAVANPSSSMAKLLGMQDRRPLFTPNLRIPRRRRESRSQEICPAPRCS